MSLQSGGSRRQQGEGRQAGREGTLTLPLPLSLSLQGWSLYPGHRSSCLVPCLPAGGLKPHSVHVPCLAAVLCKADGETIATRHAGQGSPANGVRLSLMGRRYVVSVLLRGGAERLWPIFCFQTKMCVDFCPCLSLSHTTHPAC